MSNSNVSGIAGYLYTKTSITIKYTNGVMYRYDQSEVLSAKQIEEMVQLAKTGAGLNRFLNANPEIKKYGYIDTTLRNQSFKKYG